MFIWAAISLEEYALMVIASEHRSLNEVFGEYRMRSHLVMMESHSGAPELDLHAQLRIVSRLKRAADSAFDQGWIALYESGAADAKPSLLSPDDARAAIADDSSWICQKSAECRTVFLATTARWDDLAAGAASDAQ